MNFKLEILANFEFLGVSNLSINCSKNTKFHLHFQLKLKWENKTSYFLAIRLSILDGFQQSTAQNLS